jgi:hypothetical protein
VISDNPHDERHDGAQPQALADRPFKVLQRREILGVERPAARDPTLLVGQAIDDFRAGRDFGHGP